MATGWAGDGAVQEQIDATIKDGIARAKDRLPKGPSLSAQAWNSSSPLVAADPPGASTARRTPNRTMAGT